MSRCRSKLVSFMLLPVCALILLFIFAQGATAQVIKVPFTIESAAIPDLGLPIDSANSTIREYNNDFSQLSVVYGKQNSNEWISLIISFYPANTYKYSAEWFWQWEDSYKKTTQALPAANVMQSQSSRATNSYSYIWRGTTAGSTDVITGKRGFLLDDRYIIVTIQANLKGYNDLSAKKLMSQVENKANQLLGRKSENDQSSVDIIQYSPLEPGKASAASRNVGDMIITVKDGEGQPAKNQKVYVFTEKLHGSDFPGYATSEIIAFYAGAMDKPDNTFVGCPAGSKWDSYRVLQTNEYGIAEWNYVSGLYADRVGELITKNGHADCKVWAVVFDKDPWYSDAQNPRPATVNVIASDTITIDFTSIAIITKISSKDPASQKVRVMSTKDGSPTGSKQVTNTMVPYLLQPGDIILMAQGDKVDIDWLSGYRCHVETKPGYWGPGENEFARVYIGNKDLGWYQWAVQRTPGVGTLAGGIAGQGFWAVVGTPNPYKLGLTGVTTAFFLALNFGDAIRSPIVAVPRSTFMVDFGNNSTTIYTIEGHVTLVNDARKSDNVSTGQKIVVSDKGVYSSITAFQETGLSSEQQQAIDEFTEETGDDLSDQSGFREGQPKGLPSCCPCCPFAPFAIAGLLVVVTVLYRRR